MEFTFDLNTIWFMLVGILFMGYAILDGFDLGVGALHLFTKTDTERRLMINSIGPVWDGNEVWLVTGGGALFAAFPHAYATAFSGFYIAMMALLFGLIFRAVAIEFRSKRESKLWRKFWDVSFSISSIVSALLIGVAMGNLVRGVPIDENMEFAGTFLGLLNPYALLAGVTTVALFVMHGAIYVVMKTEGELQARVRGWINKTIVAFILCYVALTVAAFTIVPHMLDNMKAFPLFFIVPVVNALAVVNIPRAIRLERYMTAFVSSCVSMAMLFMLLGIGMFPNLILSNPNPEHSLTIYNAASSLKTHKIMLIIAILGMPLVISYTISIYWVFRGKVKLDAHSY